MPKKLEELNNHTKVFIVLVSILAIISILISYEFYFGPVYTSLSRSEIIFWAILVIFSESCLIYLPLSGYLSIGTAIDIPIIIIFGPFIASLYGALGAVSSLVVRRAPLYKILFNIALFMLTMGVSSWLFHSLTDSINFIENPQFILAFLLTVAVYFFLNSGLLSIAIGLSDGISPKTIWLKNHSWTIPYLVVLSAIGYLMVMVNFALGKWAIILLLLPVLLIRKAYSQYMDLKKIQDQLIRSERLAAVGQMAAGISHEIDNPMSVILGYSDYLLKNLPQDSTIRKEVGIIRKEAQRCKSTIREYLDFSRPKAQVEYLDVHTVIHNTISLLKYEIKSRNVDVVFETNGESQRIMGDKKQLGQVFLNIMLNAFQAMPEGGHLTISTSMVRDSSGRDRNFLSRIWVGEDGTRYVAVRFTDTGGGISEEHLKQLFMPFFTTRAEKGGRGLGLYISHRIIEEHNGRIEIESEMGRGTTVMVLLPCLERKEGESAGDDD
jgi:signal transduction histidine kinase